MAQPQGYGVGAFGSGTTQRRGQTSQPGRYPAGLGGAIASAIATQRMGKYAHLSPSEEIELKRLYMGQLVDLKEREDKWRKGHLTASSDALNQLIDMHFKNVEAKYKSATIGADVYRTQAGLAKSLELGSLDKAVYTGVLDAFPGYALADRPGERSLLDRVKLAYGGFSSGDGKLESPSSDLGQIGSEMADGVENTLKDPLTNGLGYQATDGGLYLERKAEQGVLSTMAVSSKNVIRTNYPLLNEEQVDAAYRAQLTELEKRGVLRANYGAMDSAALQDRQGALVIMKPKVKKYLEALRSSAGASSTDQDRLRVIEALIMQRLDTKPGDRPPEIFDVPSLYTDEIEMIRDEIARLVNKDPYAPEVLRIKEIDGFQELKTAMGIKGGDYESDRKAVFLMSKNPKKTSLAFRLVHEARRAGVSEAKRDLMFRDFVKTEGLLGARALVGFDAETSARAKMAGVTVTEATMMDQTVEAYRQTKEFKIIKAPMVDRYKEFQAQWLKDSGFSGQAFMNPDGSMAFANAIAEGAWSNASASFLSKQTVFNNETGLHDEEPIGDEAMDLMLKDATFVDSKATAIAMARDTDLLAEEEEEPVPERTTYVDENGNKYAFSEHGIEVIKAGGEPVFLSRLEDATKIARLNDYLRHPDRKLTYVPEEPSAFEMVKGFEEGVVEEPAPGLEKTSHTKSAKEKRLSESLARTARGLDVPPKGTLERDWKPLTEGQEQVVEAESIAPVSETAALEPDKPKPKSKKDTKTTYDDSKVTTTPTAMDIPFGGKTVQATTVLSPSGVTVAVYQGKRLMLTKDGFREATPKEQERLNQPRSK